VVLHVRSGDLHLVNGKTMFDMRYLFAIRREVSEVMFAHQDKAVLLIADNNKVKTFLQTTFPRMKCLFNDITHLGEGVVLERDKVKNTLLDFYLMSAACSIHSFTTYPHGSGFSYWCAQMFGMPYRCKYLDVSKMVLPAKGGKSM
jgi:hypothetical protein